MDVCALAGCSHEGFVVIHTIVDDIALCHHHAQECAVLATPAQRVSEDKFWVRK